MTSDAKEFSENLYKIEEAINNLRKIKMSQLGIEGICAAIHEKVFKHCKDYPGYKNLDPHEALYALDTTMEGIIKANDDLHEFIKWLIAKINGDTPLVSHSYESLLAEFENRKYE